MENNMQAENWKITFKKSISELKSSEAITTTTIITIKKKTETEKRGSFASGQLSTVIAFIKLIPL